METQGVPGLLGRDGAFVEQPPRAAFCCRPDCITSFHPPLRGGFQETHSTDKTSSRRETPAHSAGWRDWLECVLNAGL